MGSFLSIIVNNTPDMWVCKIGPDEAAMQIFGIIAAVVGTLAAGVAAGPAGAGIAITGTVEAITAAATAAGVVATVAGFMQVVVDNSVKDLVNNGFVKIEPGQSHQWGKMSLSLWQQGTCFRHRKLSDTEFAVDRLLMRPIFSGATDNGNLDHEIQWWINKWGTDTTNLFARAVAAVPQHLLQRQIPHYLLNHSFVNFALGLN